ncbi:uncharacterized protein LOC131038465 isoform X1 [Cryptomeria japonica]|uniref:uncharacterized protein LOC131038465 isoform X1 n=1 Tax=Cryptomeria japonica TaxID=3369 RepID=UPI0027DA8A75|nr:uncharacterized protein LOC131038465 isoform X1 [Cryptomeria japonica]
MEAKASCSAKVYSRRKTKGAQLSCFTEEYSSASSPMKKRKRNSSSSSSSSSSEDSDFDCNEEDFNCTPSPPIKRSQPKSGNPARNRKKLALPKAPRLVRKSKTSDTEKMAVNRSEIDVFDSDEDTLPCNSKNDQGFEMLVEAAALHKDGGYVSALPSPKSDRNVYSGAKKVETKIGECSSEKESNGYSISEDDEDNIKDENYCAEDSDSLEKTKCEQIETNKTNLLASHATKARSRLATQQTSSVFETVNSAKLTIKINEENKGAELSDTGQAAGVGEPNKEPGKNVVTKRKTCGKLVSASLSSNFTEKSRTEGARARCVPLGLTGMRATSNSNLEFSAENNSSPNGCLKISRFQASSAPHQRVIGLSRRVRPPPLHPYLSKTDK